MLNAKCCVTFSPPLLYLNFSSTLPGHTVRPVPEILGQIVSVCFTSFLPLSGDEERKEHFNNLQ